MKEASEILTSCEKFHIKLGLERIEKILKLLDNPQEKYKVIHIAGTNGKGSVSKIINQILIEHFKNEDVNIGLFTSPHLFSYEERIKINNEDISKNVFNRLINNIDNLAKSNNIELSEFELLSAVAFYYFYLKNAKYVILETGLGGLYDATNVIKKPIFEVITTLDFDHTERLGSAIEEIALQKAGIIKKNSKVIVSKDNLGFEIIKKTALEKNAQLIIPCEVEIKYENNKNYAYIDSKKYEFNLLGLYQAQNLSLALAFAKEFKVKQSDLKNALKNVYWKFRFEYIKDKNILIDSAHNPSGATVLKDALEYYFKKDKKTLIFGCLKNKDYKKMFDILLKHFDRIYFYEFDYPNSLKYSEFQDKYGFEKISDISKIKEIIEKDKNLKVFAGSIYMLGKIFSEIELK